MVLDLDPVLERAGLTMASAELELALQDGAGRIFFGEAGVLSKKPVLCEVPLPEGRWMMAAAPGAGWLGNRGLALGVAWAAAALSAFLLALLSHGALRRQNRLAEAVRERTRELQARNDEFRLVAEQAELARAAADASAHHLREVMGRVSDGFASIDRNWIYTYVNPRLAEFVGRKAEELLGHSIWAIFPEAVGTPVYEAYQRAMKQETASELEHFYAPFRRWFIHRFYPSASGLSVFTREISERKNAELALRESEALSRRIATLLPIPLYYARSDGSLLFVNERFLRVFGLRAEEVESLDTLWGRLIPAGSGREAILGKWGRAVAEATAKGTDIAPVEFTATCRDGSLLRIEASGAVVGPDLLVTLNDITERRRMEDATSAAQAETRRLLEEAEDSRRALLSVIEDQKATDAALRESEQRYRSLVETSSDWVWEVDHEGRYTYASARSQQVLGFAPKDIVGHICFDFMPEEEAARVRAVFEKLAAARRPIVAFENINRHRDGHLVPIETSGIPVYGADGALIGYRGIDRDISERRAAEKALRLRDAALQAAANAIIITDRDGCIEWANPAFSVLSGWPGEEARGKNPRDLVRSGEHDSSFYQEMWDTILSGRVWRGEVINRRKDQSLRTEEMTITPVRDATGEISHFIAIKQDVTERKAMEAHARQGQRMEAIGSLAGGIAHDLNNILAPTLMVTEILKQKLDDEADRELLSMLQVSARRGAEIIKQLLTFSRGLEGEKVAVQPRHILKDMVLMMRETFPRDIELRQRLDGELWTVLADPTQLHQVVLNLCVNARDAMPDGGVLTVTANNRALRDADPELPPGAAPGRFVLIEVRDTGQGIPVAIRHRIFDPFFTTKPIGQGTGLGLATVMGIVRAHGGFIGLESETGKGTAFRVFLPASTTVAAETVSERPAPQPRGAGQLILLVDDERNVREATGKALEHKGFRVLKAQHGEEALNLYFKYRAEVALVVIDLMMPVMGGVAFIKALRGLDAQLPVLVATGLLESEMRKDLAGIGVDTVLEKPLERDVLLEAIQAHLSRG
ncbi:MAG TPA: PAS domain S-box protein [Opitutaceae bacterium]|nr:PAS domain S-box protein [Opitutaceae bacterium]